jgi:hypothetical protein
LGLQRRKIHWPFRDPDLFAAILTTLFTSAATKGLISKSYPPRFNTSTQRQSSASREHTISGGASLYVCNAANMPCQSPSARLWSQITTQAGLAELMMRLSAVRAPSITGSRIGGCGGVPNRPQALGFTLVRRRTDEPDLCMNWSGYTTEYTTSAEYPSNRAHSPAGPSIE